MCSFDQIGPCQSHNNLLNGTIAYKTKNDTILAWGVSYVYSRQRLFKTQKNMLDLGSPKTTKAYFDKIMKAIAENELWCCHGKVRISFTKEDKIAEAKRLDLMCSVFKSGQDLGGPIPVALFTWKLLDVTELWASKEPKFLERNQRIIESFHQKLSAALIKVQKIRFDNNTEPQTNVDSNVNSGMIQPFSESRKPENSDTIHSFLESTLPDESAYDNYY